MRGFAVAEDKDEFVLGPVEGSHSALVFGPDTEVEQGIIGLITSGKNLANMSPVHTRKVDGTRFTMPDEESEARSQEIDELCLCHFP